MADDAPQPVYTLQDLPGLYAQAVATGQAGELVRALCVVHGVNLRGLAELTGVANSTIRRWTKAGSAEERTLRDLVPLLRPTRVVQRGIANAQKNHPAGRKGRPQKSA